MYAQDSVDMLTGAGIQFKRHEEEGVEVDDFAELLMSSGLVLMDDVTWITFARYCACDNMSAHTCPIVYAASNRCVYCCTWASVRPRTLCVSLPTLSPCLCSRWPNHMTTHALPLLSLQWL